MESMINLVENSVSVLFNFLQQVFEPSNFKYKRSQRPEKIKSETELLLDFWVAEYKCCFFLSVAWSLLGQRSNRLGVAIAKVSHPRNHPSYHLNLDPESPMLTCPH